MITSVSVYLFLVFCVETGEFQRFTFQEMEVVLKEFNYTENESSIQCQPVMNGEWFPEFEYYYFLCDLNESAAKQLITKKDPKDCPGFDCWESQLTDSSKLEILNIMNTYRQKVAQGTCSKWCQGGKKHLVFELRWYQFLEQLAIQNVKCIVKFSLTDKISRSIFYDNSTIQIDVITTSFEMRTTLQRELRIILWRLMSENYLNDWDKKTGAFRRGLLYDVGCGFIMRRNTNFKTALNETVKSGNVGHLTCVFATTATSSFAPDIEPSDANCKSIPINFWRSLNPLSNYPSLCKLDLTLNFETLRKPIGICHLEPQHTETQICQDSIDKRSEKTWKEVSYGYTFKYDSSKNITAEAKCYKPQPASLVKLPLDDPQNRINFVCSLKQEVNVRGDPIKCRNWNCKDSQLKDETKVNILASLNKARQLVARGECSEECSSPCKYCKKVEYCNMVKLRWHWFLEMQAAQRVERCPVLNGINRNVKIDGPFADPIFFEEVTLIFDLPPSGQIDLPARISKLFWMNAFNDWSDDAKFNRGNALWIGCSIITRPGFNIVTMKPQFQLKNGVATHMVCIYGVPEEYFVSISGSSRNQSCCPTCSNPISGRAPCLINSTKNIFPYRELCTSVLSDVTMTCEVNHCDSGKSEAWETVLPGVTIYEDVNGLFRAVTRQPKSPSKTIENNPYFQKYCKILFLMLIILLLLLCVVLSLIFRFVTEKQVYEKKSSPKTPRASAPKPVKTKSSPETPRVSAPKPVKTKSSPEAPRVSAPKPVKTKSSLEAPRASAPKPVKKLK